MKPKFCECCEIFEKMETRPVILKRGGDERVTGIKGLPTTVLSEPILELT